MDFISLSELQALLNVVIVDLVLAGDNAIVVGIAVAGLPAHIIGLLLAGGLLLLWVCWKLWRELRAGRLVDISMSLDNVLSHHLTYRGGSWACGRRAI